MKQLEEAKTMKLYSIFYQGIDPFAWFDEVVDVGDIDTLQPDGAAIFWGGEDISSRIYNQKPNRFMSKWDVFLSQRDKFEVAAYHRAVELKMPIIGICRGAQLACALNGGTLIQHVEGHHGKHDISTFDGLTISTNSIHHQMMNLQGTVHELLAKAAPKLSKHYYGPPKDGEDFSLLDVDVEPEIVWFPETRTLAIQGHPEYLTPKHELTQYCLKQFKEKTGCIESPK